MTSSLITGANGSIGRHLTEALEAKGEAVRLLCREAPLASLKSGQELVIGDILDEALVEAACQGVSTVYHCAGRAHVFSGGNKEDNAAHWRINYDGAVRTARAAVKAGVKRFVFLSSLAAMGAPPDGRADEDHYAEPLTAYGAAKRKAEETLAEIGAHSKMQIISLRLAMVYGPGAPGNMERMAKMIRRGLFPPLPETGKQRSVLFIDDAIDALIHAGQSKAGPGQAYIVCDPRAYSGREMYDALRAAMGMKPISWAIPSLVLKAGGLVGEAIEKLTGRRMPLNLDAIDKLLGPACYSPDKFEKELGWRAKTSLAEGLQKTVG